MMEIFLMEKKKKKELKCESTSTQLYGWCESVKSEKIDPALVLIFFYYFKRHFAVTLSMRVLCSR